MTLASYKYLVIIAALATSCAAQDLGGANPATAVPLLRQVLGAAHTSGSIAYWGRCDFHESYPDFPRLRGLSDYSGSPVEILQKMFKPDPQMQVTMDTTGGRIRMIERDVPLDLLDIRIRRISFDLQGSGAKMFTGPSMALQIILSSPEVQKFKTENDIGPLYELYGWPGDAYAGQASISGELHDVTLLEALDYVLDTFPGFWLYENCWSDVGQRLVYFYFFQNAPPRRR